METAEYLDAVRANAARMVDAARTAGVDAPVPTCPDWKVADLAAHQGRVFRWMSTMVEQQAKEFLHPKTVGELPEGEDPIAWLATGAERALDVLGAADPEGPVWNWIDRGPGPARFWHRRMAHEVSVHRADAEAAAGQPEPTPIQPAELASDGLDEYLHFLPVRVGDEVPADLTGSYHFHATDVPGEWLVVFGAGGITVTREHAKADVAVRGPASDLEFYLYNRRGDGGLEVFGDPARLAAWRQHIHF
jgi:uncharacterized protein (TIGR03083 family)